MTERMTGSRRPLGDSHNFGRRVRLQGGRIVKPRALLWEWLLLSADSPLRRLLDQAARQDDLGDDAFGFLPTLRFYGGLDARGGEVEQLRLDPLRSRSKATRSALAGIVGRSLALWSWLGVADLHWENLVLGTDRRGRVVFGPLDIEMILAELSLPTETKLLPDADPEYAVICQHAAGVRRVLPYLGKPVEVGDLLTMAAAYRATLELLDRHSGALAKLFASLPGLRETPLRVLLRGTAEYVNAGPATWPPLLEAEAEQLERGDIPYFFRLYGRPGLHYFGNAALTELKRLPLRGDVPQLDPTLPVSRGLRSPTRQKLLADGLLAVLAAFDHPGLRGKHAHPELAVSFAARTLRVTFPDGEELLSQRDLSAFVSSVYLPCRCGEVRSVFVPPVTVCKLGEQGV